MLRKNLRLWKKISHGVTANQIYYIKSDREKKITTLIEHKFTPLV